MKRCVSALVATALFFALFASGQAIGITVDGDYSAREWDSGEMFVIVKKGASTNCAVTYATMSVLVSASESAVYFLLIADSPDVSLSEKHGAMLSVCGSSFVTMTAENSPLTYDIDNYNFRSCVSHVSSGSFACEVRVGFKHAIPNEIPLQIRLIDSTGEPSTVFFHTYVTAQEEYTTVTQATTKATTTSAPRKTTTTVEYRVNTEPRKTTTRKATTSKEKTTTAKATITKAKTTKHNTAKVSTQTPAVQAVFTQPTTTSAPSVSIVELQTLPSNAAAASYTYSGEQARKKKIIVVASSVALIAAIAAFGLFTPRKESAGAPEAGESKKED